MKLSRILPLMVGGAVAGMVVSATSPAQALTWNWSYDDGGSLNASGTFTTNDTPDGSGFYTITDITGTRNGSPITALFAPGGFGGNDNLISESFPLLTSSGFSYSAGSGNYNVYYNNQPSPYRESTGANVTFINFSASQATPVPFDTPAGQAIATFGSLFVLGLMRKAKKRLAAKKLVIEPVETVV